MWNIRVLVENVVERGLLILKYAKNVGPNQQAINHNLGVVGGGVPTIASRPGGSGVVGRLVQSLVRNFSAPLWAEARRRATKRLVFGESATFFALVGVTLVSESERGILTKGDEVEALCGNIRDAISRVGWLHNPEFWESHKYNVESTGEPSSDGTESTNSHVFSLADLELGNVIDKGCNAVVYEAKWKQVDEPVLPPVKETLSPTSSTDDILRRSSSTMVPIDEESSYQNVSGEEEEFPMRKTTSAYTFATQSNVPISHQRRDRTSSLTEDVARFLWDEDGLNLNHLNSSHHHHNDSGSDSEGEDTKPTAKRTRHIPSLDNDSLLEEDLSKQTYPLAVKMLFNYEAESNAPAILSAMYKELIPAKTLQLTETLNLWKERFLHNMTTMASHSNIVDMPCVFVDRVPSLSGSMELYPQALPMRLNPEGFGRNMSLFCVMKRYDTSLSYYLSHYSPSSHTSLLMFTQLLEAVLHINTCNIAHRDMKSDNILLSLSEGNDYPLLVLSDFGCCFADQTANLRVSFSSYEADPRQGNAALMSPEVKSAIPGLMAKIDYTRSDLWSCGAIAYEMFGHENPFMTSSDKPRGNKPLLDSYSYKDCQIPRLPKNIPGPIRRLIHDMLRRNYKNRPSPNVAATLCQLMLWAPRKWLNRHTLILPSHQEITQWLLCLTTKVLCEARMNTSAQQKDGDEGSSVILEYQLVSTLLTRVRYSDIIAAIKWNRSFY